MPSERVPWGEIGGGLKTYGAEAVISPFGERNGQEMMINGSFLTILTQGALRFCPTEEPQKA